MNAICSLRLVLAQLRHEFAASSCLILALSAALVPLLLILGLKEGTVQTLRNRLASDPVNLEIGVQFSGALTMNDIERIRALPEVGFCLPCTRLLATSAMLQAGEKSEEVNLIPSAAGDPLLRRFGVPSPGEGEIVLSSGIARKLGVNAGDDVNIRLSRRLQGRTENAEKQCKVAGILPEESNAGVQCFVILPLVVAIEEFLEGVRQSLSEEGASALRLAPVFYGIVLEPASVLDAMRAGLWAQVCPFQENRQLSAQQSLFFNTGQFVAESKVKKLYALAASHGGTVKLWNPSLDVRFQAYGKEQHAVIECIPAVPDFADSDEVLDIQSSDRRLDGELILEIGEGTQLCRVPVHVEMNDDVPAGQFRASAKTLGSLYLARYKGISWDAVEKKMKQTRRTYARLRLYARELELVEPLVEKMAALSYRTSGRIGDIRRVRQLDNQLQTLFGLVAAIGIVGAASSLALSLFNSVQRRRRDYAVLSTLGLPRKSLAWFPLYESCFLVAAALLLSFGAFHGMSSIIDQIFIGDTESGESLCRLALRHHLLIAACGFAVGIVAALVSTVAVLRVQPSTAIREL